MFALKKSITKEAVRATTKQADICWLGVLGFLIYLCERGKSFYFNLIYVR